MTIVDQYSKVNFGNPDGLYDRDLVDYFLDRNFWNRIITDDTFYVIGRKGTGKSALYKWLPTQQPVKETLIFNSSFKSFPFEKFLRLEDHDFATPNQFQSIWYYIILTSFCKLIVEDQRKKVITETWKEIAEYVEFRFGRDAKELHSTIVTNVRATTLGLKIDGLGGASTDSKKSISYQLTEMDNIREINSRLEYLVLTYLSQSGNSYIVQFDQLDDNYTLYLQDEKYFEAIISLFKVIYHFNNEIKSYNSKSKVIAYLRSDIYNRLNSRDPDSSKFDYHTFELSWLIRSATDWKNPVLKQIINKRIKNSIDIQLSDPFSYFFDMSRLNIIYRGKITEPFVYILNRTHHRPRDIIQFCIYIQKVVKDSKSFDRNCIYKAEKSYSNWLLRELSNEIAPLLGNDTSPWYAFLRKLSTNYISFIDFQNLYVANNMHMIEPNRTAEEAVKIFYDTGIIVNITRKKNGRLEYFDKVKFPTSELDLDKGITIHSGLHKGLNLSEEF